MSQITAGESFQASPPEMLFDIPPFVAASDISIPYDVAADGERFVMISFAVRGTVEGDGPQAILVQNFFEELRTRAPR